MSKTYKLKNILVLIAVWSALVAAAHAATFTVNSTADTGDANIGDGFCDAGGGVCTLRAAIEEANFTAAADTVNFAIAPFDNSVKTIQPTAPLPEITQIVVIDGYTQTGASANSLATADNAVLLIELDGTNAGAGANGLRLSTSDSTIKGLVINRFSRDGISINGGDDNLISGNFIGTDATGMFDLGNGGIGVDGEFGSGANANVVGGAGAADRNIISGNDGEGGIVFNFASNNVIWGNFIGLGADGAKLLGNAGFGVEAGTFTGGTRIGGDDAADGSLDGNVGARNYIAGSSFAGIIYGGGVFGGVTIQGNYIGTDTTGTLARPNQTGIASNLGGNSIIGGTTAGAGNLISGNTQDGINLGNTGSNIIRGNLIGTKAGGTAALANGGDGIEIYAGGGNNVIGGTGAGEGNIIAFNGEDGVQITDVGVAPVGNPILGNSIFSNGALGINLSIDTVTPNDANDADTGANRLQNYPVITAAQPGGTHVVGTFNSTPNSTFRLEFFNSPSVDASGFGEGQTFIGFITVTTDGAGNATFDQTFAFNSPLGSYVSATATDSATGDTSEFSGAKQVLSPTASSVSITGRVFDEYGRGLANAQITMTDSAGNSRAARTNQFGFYGFASVQAGEIYVLTVRRKSYVYDPLIIGPTDDLAEINFYPSTQTSDKNLWRKQ